MDWLKILTEITERVKASVVPLIKTPMADKTLGVGAGGDPKKYIDIQAENAIIETLIENELDFTLISEESGIKKCGVNPLHYVTADPVDGTTNILRGLPFACTSVAVSRTQRLDSVEAAVVADFFRDVTYLAQKQMGSYRNGQKISPSKTTSLKETLVGIDLSSSASEEVQKRLKGLLAEIKHIRHLGANALELCYVADGTTDAFVDIRGRIRPTDIAAAALIVQEAGATITTLENTALTHSLDPKERLRFIASGNKNLHQRIIGIIKRANKS
jgi:myo-inositol-1(or 4)-monophosphatase